MSDLKERVQRVQSDVDSHMVFREEGHSYLWDGKPLRSVSSVKGLVVPPFDEEFYSAKKARESNGKYTQSDIKAMWKSKRDTAASNGTKAHKVIETIYDKGCPPSTVRPVTESTSHSVDLVSNAVNNFKILYNKALHRLVPLAWELRLGNPDWRVAGTVDLVVQSVSNPNNVMIIDWKTNERLINNDTFFNYLRQPFNELPDTNYYQYCIQLNMYRLLLSHYGLEVDGMYLGWIPCVHVNTCKLIPVDYLQDNRLHELIRL